MTTALWAALLAAAALWPSRLAGPLDGAPLDARWEAAVIGVALPFAIWLAPQVLKTSICRVLIVALLASKALAGATLAQDGWCLRFTSPVPIFVDDLRVPHAWDVRADWRTNPPRCSAIMTRGYASQNEFPAWFFNLPPADFRNAARDEQRPPNVRTDLNLDGYLSASTDGVLSIATGEHITIAATLDGRAIDSAALARGVPVPAGVHHLAVSGVMTGDRWLLQPKWDGRDVWQGAVATTSAPSALDAWARPWARLIAPALVLAMFGLAVRDIVATAGLVASLWSGLASAVLALLALYGPASVVRVAPVLLVLAAALPLLPRVRNLWGAVLLVGVPFMTMLVARHLHDAGVFQWYSIGDDYWMFQRFAYRIYLQGYWLEGGQITFWFQPFYRWIAGALHMIFGDSSIGEVFWDGACAVAGGMLAFVIVRRSAGFRWGLASMVVVLAVFTAGPVWYLIGRGLSEISSMGLMCAAALLLLRARSGSVGHILLAGVCAVLAFYTRLNNLPMIAAVALFALPLSVPARALLQPRLLLARVSRAALVGITAAIVIGVSLFAARTWYYTGVFSVFHGTQGAARSVWQQTTEGLSPLQNAIGSLMLVMTMSDPPEFDPRAIPVIAGAVAAVLAVARVRPLDRLPLNAVLVCLAGFAGSLVARGSAYPGRFTTHVIPITVALFMCAISLALRRPSAAK